MDLLRGLHLLHKSAKANWRRVALDKMHGGLNQIGTSLARSENGQKFEPRAWHSLLNILGLGRTD